MNDTATFIKEINWLLEPVDKVITFLFTTTAGYIVLLSGIVLYLVATLLNALWLRRLQLKAASFSRPLLVERLYIFFQVLGNTLLNLIYKIPLILVVVVSLFALLGVSRGLRSIETFFANQEKIRELKAVVQQLDKRYKVADFEITDMVFDPVTQNTTTKLRVEYIDYAQTSVKTQPQLISIEGNEIWFDAISINFKYSEIVESGVKNLYLPHRIFSNKVPQEKGIELKYADDNGIPYIYHRASEDIYSLHPDTFPVRVKEIMTCLHDEEAARARGVRSVTGNTVFVKVFKGYKGSIWIEQTGGITLRQENDIFSEPPVVN